ncbi:MAG: MarR family transcriptional regulator [Promethearchaeota archaeon]
MIVSDMYSIDDYIDKKELISLSPSSKFILYLLKHKGPLKQSEIIKKTLLPKRTIAYSLKKLQEKNFIKKFTDNSDKRIKIYETII